MKIHHTKIKKENIQKDNVFLQVDSPGWRNPEHMNIGTLREVLEISDSDSNVVALKFQNQDENPELPPNTHKLDSKLEIAVDDNFLYVWVKNRWKRIPLSKF